MSERKKALHIGLPTAVRRPSLFRDMTPAERAASGDAAEAEAPAPNKRKATKKKRKVKRAGGSRG